MSLTIIFSLRPFYGKGTKFYVQYFNWKADSTNPKGILKYIITYSSLTVIKYNKVV